MGSCKLASKRVRNYRRGPTWRSCSDCDHFVSAWSGPHLICSCRLIGLQAPRVYRILPHYICDDFDDTKTSEERE